MHVEAMETYPCHPHFDPFGLGHRLPFTTFMTFFY